MRRALAFAVACLGLAAGVGGARAQPEPGAEPGGNAAVPTRAGRIASEAKDDDPIGRYLADLEASRRLPAETGTREGLRAGLVEAEEQLLRGDARAATSALFGLVESPRYRAFADDGAYQNAEFQLGRALLRGRAYQAAERYLVRALGRGTRAPYFVPAHRALVDLALETREYGRVLRVIEEGSGAGAAGPAAAGLPADAAQERAYLRGRVAYDRGDLDAAARHFAEVGRSSRLYAGAAYFRGLIAARERALGAARGAFCEIVGRRASGGAGDGSGAGGGQVLRFFIDGRYYALRDLAHLALGRIAHEQDRYDEAYYHYFSVPEDSERLGEALYEAAWSLYQKGELVPARAFVDEFDKLFPHSPRRPDAEVLRANLALKTCNFDGARAEVAALERTYGPIQRQAAEAASNAERRRALMGRLLGRQAPLGPTMDEDGRLLALLQLDSRFRELYAMVRDLESEAAEARAALAGWRALEEVRRNREKVRRPASSPEAAALLEDLEALVPLAAEQPALNDRLGRLLLDASLLAYPPERSAPYAVETERAAALIGRVSALQREAIDAADALAEASLRDLDARLRALLRQGRLVRIDAVVGRKKRLEIEIANIYEGRLSGALYTKLKAEGVLGDDEEYWPFEGEYWADEYENYR